MKRTIIAIALLATIIMIAGCTTPTGHATKEETIKIGALIPQTGVAAAYGEYEDQAIRLALEEINEQGIDGKRLQIIYEDTKCDAKEGAIAAQKLISADNVKAIIAFECSGPTQTALAITKEHGTPYLVAVASVPGLAKQGDNVYRIAPADDAQGKDLADAVIGRDDTAAILYIEEDYGAGVKDTFTQAYEAKGGRVIATESFNEGTDLRTQLTKLQQQHPEAVLIIGYADQYATILKTMRELGIQAQIYATETFKAANVLETTGTLAEGVITTSYESPSTNERTLFEQKMQARYEQGPGTYADFAYDAMHIMAKALRTAQDETSEGLLQALAKTTYEGATGTTSFDEEGEVKDKHFTLYQVKDGAFVPY